MGCKTVVATLTIAATTEGQNITQYIWIFIKSLLQIKKILVCSFPYVIV